MVGQIRSYILYISTDSDKYYINRIKNMIDSLHDEELKQELTGELEEKLKRLSIYKKHNNIGFRKTRFIPSKEEKIDASIGEVKTYENDTNKKELRHFRSIVDEEEETLPPVYIRPINLIKISKIKYRIVRYTHTKKKIFIKED